MFENGKRRSLAAAAGVGAAGFVILVATTVVARGPDIGNPYELLLPNYSKVAPQTAPAPSIPMTSPRRRSIAAIAGHPVCVRLCDGAYFPISTGNGEEAQCRNLCPDAATAIYQAPNGSDDIGEAVSKTGKRYSELPTALRYRSGLDAACVCHRSIAPHYSLAEDSTLRKGDYVMTRNGLAVFEGGAALPHHAADFVALDKARLSAEYTRSAEALHGPKGAPRRAIRITTP
ncbi:MAG TPA: DUF2865 domain-containing protein [Roseiarcus sp.]|nr:DUF2865 domain-containing protein [Roseiarcus sp.]